VEEPFHLIGLGQQETRNGSIIAHGDPRLAAGAVVLHHLLNQAPSIIGLDKDRDLGGHHANEREDGHFIGGDSDPNFHQHPSSARGFKGRY
jgi:hypothetical protein